MLDAARRFVVLASAEELIANPLVLAGYTSTFREEDDATLLLYAPNRNEARIVPLLTRALASAGVPKGGGPDMIGLIVPATPDVERGIAERADAVYSQSPVAGARAHLPRFALADITELRAHAELPPPPPQAGPTVAVVMCVWKRVEFLPTTLAMLERQVGVVPELHLWVNDASAEDEVRRICAGSRIACEITVSPENVGGYGRFYAARALADRHAHVVFLDDDEVFDDHALAALHGEARERTITSWYAFRFTGAMNYWERTRALPGERAEYTGTGGMVVDTAIFDDPRVYECPERYWFVEDLWLSYVADHLLGWDLRGSAANVWPVPDGRDQYAQMDPGFKPEFLGHLVARGWRVGPAPLAA